MNKIKAISIVGSMLLAVLALTGCPGPQPQDQVKSEVSVLFTASELDAAAKAYVVPAGDIARLLVSVDDVLLTPAGGADPAVSVLGAPQVVDLKELLGMAALLNRPEIPVGTYTNMQLLLSSATLYLASAPDTAITAVNMPDNGIFDVPVDITIVEGEQNKVLVDLGGITLVELNDGSYELTPDFQVRVPDPAEPIPARSAGEVKQVDLVNGFYVAERHDALVTVYFGQAVIYLPSDGTSPTGVAEDILVGDHVLAYGTLSADGAVDASVVIILRDDDDHGGDDGHGGNHGDRNDDDEGEDEGDDDGGHHGDDDGEHEGIDDSGHHGGDDDGSIDDNGSSDDEGEHEGIDDSGHHGGDDDGSIDDNGSSDDEGEHEGIDDSGNHGGDDDGSIDDNGSSDDEGEHEGVDDSGHHGGDDDGSIDDNGSSDDEGEHEGIDDSGNHGGDDNGSVDDNSSSDDEGEHEGIDDSGNHGGDDDDNSGSDDDEDEDRGIDG